MRRLALGVPLLVVWLLLWDAATIGLAVGGAAIVVALFVLLPLPVPDERPLTVRPLAMVRLLGWFIWQFVHSNLQVVRAVLVPSRWVRAGVVRVPLRTSSPTLAALVSNITALTPGMQPVDGERDPFAIHIHVLSLQSPADVEAMVQRLEDLVSKAFDPEWAVAHPAAGDGAAP